MQLKSFRSIRCQLATQPSLFFSASEAVVLLLSQVGLTFRCEICCTKWRGSERDASVRRPVEHTESDGRMDSDFWIAFKSTLKLSSPRVLGSTSTRSCASHCPALRTKKGDLYKKASYFAARSAVHRKVHELNRSFNLFKSACVSQCMWWMCMLKKHEIMSEIIAFFLGKDRAILTSTESYTSIQQIA